MFFKAILAVASLSMGAISAPTPPPSTSSSSSPVRLLENPATPKILLGYNPQEQVQIRDAIRDSFLLASYALHGSDNPVDPIFLKYFDAANRSAVLGAFNRVLTSPLLGQIAIVADGDNGDGMKHCPDLEGSLAYLTLGWALEAPPMVVCPPGFLYGGINKSYNSGEVAAVTCGGLDREVSWKMVSLGSTLLHEYMHFGALVVPALTVRPTDQHCGYRAFNTRHLDKALALSNADSY